MTTIKKLQIILARGIDDIISNVLDEAATYLITEEKNKRKKASAQMGRFMRTLAVMYSFYYHIWKIIT